MALSRVKVWVSGEILTASDLNNEFNNILNNPISLVNPWTANQSAGGFALFLDTDANSGIQSSVNDRIDLSLAGVGVYRFGTSIFEVVGTGKILQADMSNGTLLSRFALQSSTVNGDTRLQLRPNGTSLISHLQCYNNSDPTNAGILLLGVEGATTRVSSQISGTGTQLPMDFQIGAVTGARHTTTSGVWHFGSGATGTTGSTDFVNLVSSAAGNTKLRWFQTGIQEWSMGMASGSSTMRISAGAGAGTDAALLTTGGILNIKALNVATSIAAGGDTLVSILGALTTLERVFTLEGTSNAAVTTKAIGMRWVGRNTVDARVQLAVIDCEPLNADWTSFNLHFQGPLTYIFSSNIESSGLITALNNFRAQSAAPVFTLHETDQALPAGRWRLVLDGDNLSVRRNTHATTEFATETFPLTINANDQANFNGVAAATSRVIIQKDSPASFNQAHLEMISSAGDVRLSWHASGATAAVLTHPRAGNGLALTDSVGTAANLSMGALTATTGAFSSTVSTGALSVTGDANATGAFIAGTQLKVGTGGTFAAGSIYSDAAWGMLFRAKQAAPSTAIFRWSDSADVEAFRITTGNVAQFANNPTVAGTPIKVSGKETMWIPASAMYPRLTTPPFSDQHALSTMEYRTLNYDSTQDEHAYFTVAFPKSWNEGTVTFQAVWSHPATTVNFGVAWFLQGRAFSDNETGSNTFASSAVVTDTGGTTDNIFITAESPTLTIDGTPAEGDLCLFLVGRSVGNASDTLAVDARLIGIRLFYTTNAANDA